MPYTVVDQTLRWLSEHLFHVIGFGFLWLAKREWSRQTDTLTTLVDAVAKAVTRLEVHEVRIATNEEAIKEVRGNCERRRYPRTAHSDFGE